MLGNTVIRSGQPGKLLKAKFKLYSFKIYQLKFEMIQLSGGNKHQAIKTRSSPLCLLSPEDRTLTCIVLTRVRDRVLEWGEGGEEDEEGGGVLCLPGVLCHREKCVWRERLACVTACPPDNPCSPPQPLPYAALSQSMGTGEVNGLMT